jgi:hypothetical protein
LRDLLQCWVTAGFRGSSSERSNSGEAVKNRRGKIRKETKGGEKKDTSQFLNSHYHLDCLDDLHGRQNVDNLW